MLEIVHAIPVVRLVKGSDLQRAGIRWWSRILDVNV